ncbi:MAG: HAD family phosphatase [Chlamydiota bacterium]
MKWSHLAVFDLDKTIVESNCSFDFCRYLVSRKVLPGVMLFRSFIYYVRHMFFGLDLLSLHRSVFTSLLKGMSLPVLEQNVELFLKSQFFSKIYPPVLAQLRRAQHLGHYTLILSNSPSFLVNKIAQFLGVDEARATEYAVDKDQNLCHIASVMQGQDKASCLKEIAGKLSIDKSNITAYSDSILDLPLLLSAGTAIAVKPDRKLRRFSEIHQWTIL